jgi:predicted secreted protein
MKTRAEEIELKAGRTFSAVFTEAASAGYLWSVSGNKSGLEVACRALPSPAGGEMAVGMFGEVEFSATPATPGTYELEFTHKRPWEKEAAEIVRYTLRVSP